MTINRLRGPGELIAAVPALLGFEPRESVVVVGLACGGEMGALMRLDRRDLLIPEIAADAASGVASQLRRERAIDVLIVSFTRDRVPWGCPAADALVSGLSDLTGPIGVWVCDGERYRNAGCRDPECCPAQGSPIPPTPDLGIPRARRITDVADVPPPRVPVAPARERRRASRAGDRWWARRELQVDAWRARALDGCLASMRRDAGALDLGRAAVALRDVRVRDAVIVSWSGGSDAAVRDVLAGDPSADVANALDGALHDVDREPPSQAAVRIAIAWCLRVAGLARTRDAAPPLTLAAVAAWWAGDLEQARALARAATDEDAEYSLARLMIDVCGARLEPAWMRN